MFLSWPRLLGSSISVIARNSMKVTLLTKQHVSFRSTWKDVYLHTSYVLLTYSHKLQPLQVHAFNAPIKSYYNHSFLADEDMQNLVYINRSCIQILVPKGHRLRGLLLYKYIYIYYKRMSEVTEVWSWN